MISFFFYVSPDVVVIPPDLRRWGHYEIVGSVCLSVCLCLLRAST